MKSIFVVLLILSGLATGCRKSSDPSALKRYEFKGRIVEVTNREKKVLKISHQEVKDFMSAMTMNFPVKGDITGIEAGDEIAATLVYNSVDNRSWLEEMKVVRKGAAAVPVAVSPAASVKAQNETKP